MGSKVDNSIIYKLKGGIGNKVEELIKKNTILKWCKNSVIYVPVVGIGGAIAYCFLKYESNDLNSLITKYEFNSVLFIILLYIIYIEKFSNKLEKEVEKDKNNFRNKMILRICNCSDNCNCKEELNQYMKKKGSGII